MVEKLGYFERHCTCGVMVLEYIGRHSWAHTLVVI